jgi:membrane dipeptidase
VHRRTFLGGSAGLAAAAAAPGAAPNARIQTARDAALAVLKPSAKDLEHGLELHANSLVIEPYGFSPRPAVDGDVIRQAIAAGASELELQDMTEDMSMTRCVTSAAERQEYMDAWKASGITCIFQNAGEESQDPMRLIKRLARFTYTVDMLGGFLRRAAVPDDIVAAHQAGQHCLYMSGNGVPLPGQWVSVEEELRYIRIFFQLGVRMMHLTYNRRNMIGDGCAEPGNAGLSDFGRAAVKEMNRVGVIADVAHAGWQTSLEAAKVSAKPMVASHTCCAALNRHIRSKPDEVIRAIADTGGFVGICAVGQFIGRTADIAAMLDHIDYLVKRFGADRAAIATDSAYVSRNADAEYRKIPRRRQVRAAWESFWPQNSYPGGPSHASLAWSNWPLFTVGLVQRGHSDADIQKIIGGNALRVARAVMTVG